MLDSWLDNRAQRRFNNKLDTARRRRDASLGVSVLEMALVLPVLLMIIGGVVDMGMAFHTYIAMVNSAREGARYGINHAADTGGIRARVLMEASNSNVDLTSATVSVSGGSSGSALHVNVDLDHTPAILGTVLGIPAFPMHATAVFRAR